MTYQTNLNFKVYFILKTILIAQIGKTQRAKGNLKNCIQTKKEYQ